jgi:hypothetical protein
MACTAGIYERERRSQAETYETRETACTAGIYERERRSQAERTSVENLNDALEVPSTDGAALLRSDN